MSSIQISLDAALILAGAIYGYILSISLSIGKEGNETAKKLAGCFVLVYSIHITEYIGLISGLIFSVPQFIGLTFPLLLLVGPIFLLYAEALNETDFKFQKRHALYAIPFLLWQAYFISFYLYPTEKKIEFLNQMASVEIYPIPFLYGLSSLLVNLLFVHLAYRRISKYESWLVDNSSSDRILRLKWTRKLAFVFAVLIAFNTLSFIIGKIDNSYLLMFDVIFVLGMIVMIIVIGLNAQNQPLIYNLTKSETRLNDISPKYQTSSLDPVKISDIKSQLVKYMQEQKPYLDSELKISDLADQIDIPAHHLSQTINQEFGTNFFEFINEYRIESSKEMLRNEQFDYFKILAVAIENGFNNKASFNRVFKRYSGVTPSEYRKQRKETVEAKESYA